MIGQLIIPLMIGQNLILMMRKHNYWLRNTFPGKEALMAKSLIKAKSLNKPLNFVRYPPCIYINVLFYFTVPI